MVLPSGCTMCVRERKALMAVSHLCLEWGRKHN